MAAARNTRVQKQIAEREARRREERRLQIIEERKDTTKYFEGVYIGFMLNQAAMNFFRVGSYPHYKVCETTGVLVIDQSEETKALKARALATQKLIKDIADRQKRGMRIPKTWIAKVEAEESFIMALDELKVSFKEWSEEFYRMLRWFKTI